MTLGIGIACAEGVVVMADSMMHDMTATGRVPRLGRKLTHIPAARMWAMNSGYVDLLPALGPLIEETSFQSAVGDIFEVLRRVERKKIDLGRVAGQDDPVYLDYESTGAPQLLAARAWQGEAPRLARLSPSGEDWPAAGEPAILPVGCWVRHYLGPQGLLRTEAPATLQGCRELAVQWGRDYLNVIYDGRTLAEIVRTGLLPTIAWPLSVITIDAMGRTTQEEIAA